MSWLEMVGHACSRFSKFSSPLGLLEIDISIRLMRYQPWVLHMDC